ncbi:MAG: GBS Bsp-like repeat-containing protein [Lachnospiraceae bacterium]|nr:GBS Bsp-like repeat-containing protein [Lachnospiraceae bacterium]
MAKSAAAAYAAEVDVSRHQSQGLYNAHVYALMADGTKAFLGKTTFEVVFKVTGTVTGENPDTNDAGFDAVFRVTEATPDITKVQIPVWCASDQSDIVWYDAEKVDDTTYKVKVRAVNHKGNLGTYKIHVYATLESGIRLFAGSANYEFNPPSVLLVFNDQQYGYRRIVLKNAPAGLKSVSFPAWSKKNGQDDIVWYTGKKNSSTEWQCVIDSAKHKDGGTFLVHCYGDGDTLLGGITFNFPASEFGKNGWVYEGGYKLYYDHNKLVTDVEYLIGKQSSYVLRVNRTTCTVTVYAYDSAKGGYIIPVKVFLCSVGTAKDPSPVGTFHTSAKYRWKAMNGPSFAQYATRIVDHVLFHSIPCPDYGQPWDQYQVPAYKYNLLGQPASQGCIRLQCASAKWIYDNCPIGTTVVIYDSPNPGPLGKPVLVPIPESQTWDPTDPSVNR